MEAVLKRRVRNAAMTRTPISASPNDQLSGFVDDLNHCKSIDEAWCAFNGALNGFGIDHALYGFMATLPRKSISTEFLCFSSHKPEFGEAYIELGHVDHDWSVEWCMKDTRAQRWNTPDVLEFLTSRQHITEQLAYDFGLFEGLVVPLRGGTAQSWGGLGMAAPSVDSKEWGRILKTYQVHIEALVQSFHEYVLGRGYYDHFNLSNRENEVLKWIVCGLSKHEIADKLGISSRTAEVHVYRIRRKLNCVNDAQVTAKALVFNLVSV